MAKTPKGFVPFEKGRPDMKKDAKKGAPKENSKADMKADAKMKGKMAFMKKGGMAKRGC